MKSKIEKILLVGGIYTYLMIVAFIMLMILIIFAKIEIDIDMMTLITLKILPLSMVVFAIFDTCYNNFLVLSWFENSFSKFKSLFLCVSWVPLYLLVVYLSLMFLERFFLYPTEITISFGDSIILPAISYEKKKFMFVDITVIGFCISTIVALVKIRANRVYKTILKYILVILLLLIAAFFAAISYRAFFNVHKCGSFHSTY